MNMEKYSQITLKSTAHYNRTVNGIKLDNVQDLNRAIQNGCGLQEVNYILRYPEVMLCDLSNPEFPLNLCDNDTIVDCYNLINLKLDKSLENTNFTRIFGDNLKAEIAINGPSKEELIDFKEKFLSEIYRKLGIYSKVYLDLFNSKGLHPIRNIDSISLEAQREYTNLIDKYKEYIKPEAYSNIKLFNINNVYQNHMVWADIQKMSDFKLFILTAGLPLALGYVNSTQDCNIFFTEVHRQNDPYQLYRKELFDFIHPSLNQTGKVAIIDKMYTGGSINQVADSLNVLDGISVVKVGLFPKAYDSLKTVDYVVYGGRLIDSQHLITNCTEEDWHIKALYI